MDIETVKRLAEQSKSMGSLPDEYAEQRCRWAYDPQNKDKPMWWGKEQPYYKFLYLIAKHHCGGAAIEVGTHAGIGFSCLAAGAKASANPKSWTIGIDKDSHETAREVAAHYPNCVFILGISIDIMPQIEKLCREQDIKIAIMFIDATHTLNWVNAEISAYKHLFADRVVVIMDDCFTADNNTKLPECFANLPGQRALFPGLHTDNCIGVAVASKAEFDNWNPHIVTGLTL